MWIANMFLPQFTGRHQILFMHGIHIRDLFVLKSNVMQKTSTLDICNLRDHKLFNFREKNE